MKPSIAERFGIGRLWRAHLKRRVRGGLENRMLPRNEAELSLSDRPERNRIIGHIVVISKRERQTLT